MELVRSVRAEPESQAWRKRQPGMEERLGNEIQIQIPALTSTDPIPPFGKFQKRRYRFLICKTSTFTKGLAQSVPDP